MRLPEQESNPNLSAEFRCNLPPARECQIARTKSRREDFLFGAICKSDRPNQNRAERLFYLLRSHFPAAAINPLHPATARKIKLKPRFEKTIDSSILCKVFSNPIRAVLAGRLSLWR